MGHISELAIFDSMAGRGDLTTQESEHLQVCPDCRELAVGVRRSIDDSGDVGKTRRFLVEHGTLPVAEEAPAEIHEDQRELDERPG